MDDFFTVYFQFLLGGTHPQRQRRERAEITELFLRVPVDAVVPEVQRMVVHLGTDVALRHPDPDLGLRTLIVLLVVRILHEPAVEVSTPGRREPCDGAGVVAEDLLLVLLREERKLLLSERLSVARSRH